MSGGHSGGGDYRVVSSHSGAEFESGDTYRRRGVNEPHPGVEPEPASDGEEQQRAGAPSTGLADYYREQNMRDSIH